eukprot:1323154-Prymnesium_polylepis.1
MHGCPVGPCERPPLLEARGSPVGRGMLAHRARTCCPSGTRVRCCLSGTCGRVSSDVAPSGRTSDDCA